VIGLLAQVLLLAVLAATAGLGAAGWVAGVGCAVIMAAALARGLARRRGERLGPASWLTLTRATLAVGVAALAADSFTSTTPVAIVVTLAATALALDAVDGWLARRTATATALGARFDGEVDAFLILVLAVYVAKLSDKDLSGAPDVDTVLAERIGRKTTDAAKRIDYGFRGTHVTAVAAKDLTTSFYGKAPQHAYFQGCSNGGRWSLP
jgi:hypothetical protein